MLGRAPRLLLSLLIGPALVEVLNDHAHKHVEHKEPDQEQERDEVEQAPLVVVAPRLQVKIATRKLLLKFNLI